MRRIRQATLRRTASAVLVASVMSLAGCTGISPEDGPAQPAPSDSVGPFNVEVVAPGLAAPWSVVTVGGSLLVSERDAGRVREVTADGRIRDVGIVADAAGSGEGGLLGMALDERQRLYAYLTTAQDNRIQRFDLEGRPGALRLGESETIIAGIPAGVNHNGGRLAFGPDGMLYAGAGDAGEAGHAQDVRSLAGKILRMTPDGDAPDDNPFPGSLVYSYGHRNVQGFAWAADGTMFASEFGQDTWDELNIIEAGGDYGWPRVEGRAGDPAYIDPVQQWTPDDASPSGMAIVGDTIYIANLAGRRLRAVPVGDPAAHQDLLVGEYGRLRDVVGTVDGGILVLTNNTDGRGDPGPEDDRLLRLTPPD